MIVYCCTFSGPPSTSPPMWASSVWTGTAPRVLCLGWAGSPWTGLYICIFAYDNFDNSSERQDFRLPVVSNHIDSRHPHTFSKPTGRVCVPTNHRYWDLLTKHLSRNLPCYKLIVNHRQQMLQADTCKNHYLKLKFTSQTARAYWMHPSIVYPRRFSEYSQNPSRFLRIRIHAHMVVLLHKDLQ